MRADVIATLPPDDGANRFHHARVKILAEARGNL
jgi:hypothetical protein